MAFKNHRFSRLELLVGREGLGRFRSKHVAVFGVGGVGSFAAEGMARAAVGKISLIDHDEVCVTNVNRQLHAFTDTVGEKKVALMAERIRRINPLLEVFAFPEHHHPDKGNQMLEAAESAAGAPVDLVLDCIDTLAPKVDLIERCVRAGIPVISSMGAASRLDPSLITVADISETKVDPFAKQVRTKLRERGINTGVTAIFSTEMPLDPEQAVPGTEWHCICPTIEKQFGACQHKRVMLGTISYMPAMFGLWMVSAATRHWLEGIDLSKRDTFEHTPTFEELQRAMSLAQSPAGS
ncbi:MAG: tRNA threonylcarbamoyladenosine dehydratase [Betaproteobacteria bacterium]|nr:tRNA threonylcarbamoyladenosine dehydratase [Betaproteobacteria bacterium]